MELELDVRIPMRDGIVLNAEVWRPRGSGPVPAILIRSPYPDPVARAALDPVRSVRRGIAVVVQQIRGTGMSDGSFEPWTAEATDGADSIAWCAAQEWCSGDVATTGLSYLAHAQLYAAGELPEALRAMSLEVVPNDAYGLTYPGGALALGSSVGWAVAQVANALLRRAARGEDVSEDLRLLDSTVLDPPELLRRPLRQITLLERHFPSWRDWLDHPTRDGWWRARDCGPLPPLPTLCVGGWFDIFLRGTLDTWRAASLNSGSRLVIGPWAHNGRTSALGEMRFGSEALSGRVDLMGQELDFLSTHLEQERPDSSPASPPEPPVRVFVMGINRWREFGAWPPPEAVAVDYYLHAQGGLSELPPPADAEPQPFTFEPADPVPTLGGPNLLSDSEAGYYAGPWDQSALDGRTDILRFATGPLAQPVEVIGELSVTLWASTSARDTDWTAKLIDVRPDGVALNIADGIIRARHRLGVERTDLPVPGEVCEYVIDLVATAHVFAAGHRLRLDISSSNFPRFDVNPGNGELMADAGAHAYMTARQRVFVDAAHPSRVTLPVMSMAD